MRLRALAFLALALAGCNSGTSQPLQPPPVAIEGLRTQGERSLLLAFVGGSPAVDPSDPCWVGYRPEVVASDAQVVVTVHTVQSSALVPRLSGCTMEGYPRAMVVELPWPLDGRRVVDGATGEEHVPFDGSTLLHPRTLPPGWALLREEPGFDEPERSRSWIRTWGPPPEPGPVEGCVDAIRVDLVQRPDPAPPALGPGTAEPVDVRGTRGLLLRRPGGQVALTWSEPGGQRELIGSRTCAGAAPVDLDVLLRFAESLE